MSDAVLLALIVGAVNWGLRYLPLRLNLRDVAPSSRLGGFLAATGPAAIATLFVAEALPFASTLTRDLLPLVAGVAAVLGIFAWRRSVVLATWRDPLPSGLPRPLSRAEMG
jgi:branched-subunit amino acid transport protein